MCMPFNVPITMIVQDRYAVERSLPPIDASQDWTLISGEEVDGYTIIRFARSWVTCDDKDRDITVRVHIFTDPTLHSYDLKQYEDSLYMTTSPVL